jgi:hypothetical protein
MRMPFYYSWMRLDAALRLCLALMVFQGIQFIFSDHDGGSVVRMPFYYSWMPLLGPVLKDVFKSSPDLINHIIRLQVHSVNLQ